MRRLVKLLLLLLVAGTCLGAAGWQWYRQHQRDSIRPSELYNIVWAQVRAFQEEDYPLAYRQVSADFQERFNIEAFTDLVHTDYPPLRVADRIEFGAVQWDGRRAVVPAYFFLPQGEVIPCFYTFVQEDGGWKIDSVRAHRRWPAGRRLGGLRS